MTWCLHNSPEKQPGKWACHRRNIFTYYISFHLFFKGWKGEMSTNIIDINKMKFKNYKLRKEKEKNEHIKIN